MQQACCMTAVLFQAYWQLLRRWAHTCLQKLVASWSWWGENEQFPKETLWIKSQYQLGRILPSNLLLESSLSIQLKPSVWIFCTTSRKAAPKIPHLWTSCAQVDLAHCKPCPVLCKTGSTPHNWWEEQAAVMEKAATESLDGTTLLEVNECIMCEVLSTVKESKEQQCAHATTLGGSPENPTAGHRPWPGLPQVHGYGDSEATSCSQAQLVLEP